MPEVKSEQERAAEAKLQQDFLSDASEIDDTLDFDDDGLRQNESDEEANANSDGGDANAQMTDAEVSAAGGDKQKENEQQTQTPTSEAGTVPDPNAQTPPTSEIAPPTTPDPNAPGSVLDNQAPQTQEVQQEQQFSQEEIARVYNDWRGQTEKLLADHHYVLNQETTEELEIEPAKVIPRLMARVYLDAVTAAIGQITQHMPRLISVVNEQQQTLDKSENKFFTRWPDLGAHKDAVIRMGMAYRSSNPSASEEQFINEVGAQAMVSLRLNPSFIPSQVPPQAPAAPFVPGAQSAPTGMPRRQPSNNIFEQLNSDFDMEEEIDGR